MHFVKLPLGPALAAGCLITLSAHCGDAQTLQYAFTNFAGLSGGFGNSDGLNSAARFASPAGLAVDQTGNLYVADTANHTIRKVTPAGMVSTLAGSAGQPGSTDGTSSAARFNAPAGLALDDTGNLYATDAGNFTIRKITPAGAVTTLAGRAGQSGSIDGTGREARFALGSYQISSGVAVDHAGNIYVADSYNHTIRKITPGGMVTTLAGSAGQSGADDGVGASARFYLPTGIAVDASGNVYVADGVNVTIRKITPAGEVSTLAGSAGQSGTLDGIGSEARFGLGRFESVKAGPSGMAIDPAGSLYLADSANNAIRKVTSAAVVTTLAGSPGQWGSADGFGSQAQFSWPGGVAVDTNGTLYVADQFNDTIRKITPAGAVSTLAGSPPSNRPVDGTGSAARFTYFYGPCNAIDKAGNLYVADRGARQIRKISPGGLVTTFAGADCADCSFFTVKDGAAGEATFSSPQSTAIDKAGNIYVGDYTAVRKITPEGRVTTLAGVVGSFGSSDGAGRAARFGVLYGLAVDDDGNIYVPDWDNHTIRKVTPAGFVTTIAGRAGQSGSEDGTGSAARFRWPTGVAVDRSGTLYVADRGNQTIRKVTPDGIVTTLAGDASITDSNGYPLVGYADGIGSAARFNFPTGLILDEMGNLLVADTDNSIIRKVTPAGLVTTLAGTAGRAGGADGIGSLAQFSQPVGVALDSSGHLYVIDSYRITKGTPILAPEPRFGGFSLSNGVLATSASGLVAGWSVVVESSTNLHDWSALDTSLATSDSLLISVPIDRTRAAQFLRITARQSAPGQP